MAQALEVQSIDTEIKKNRSTIDMTSTHLNLVVIRSADLEKAIEFYQILNLSFVKHRHGNGLEHFSSQVGQIIFEIYPQTAKMETTTDTRLGFQVIDLDAIVTKLHQQDIAILLKPTESEWGTRAVIVDPDGHKVELIQEKINTGISKNTKSSIN